MVIALLFLLGVALIGVPVTAPLFGVAVPWGIAALSIALGSLSLVASAALTIFTRLYQRTKASEAFVRTGMGGVKVIQDGGAIVVPFVHELIRVSLKTLKLHVSRDNEDALITEDKLRADIHAEFFVRVQPGKENILQASRSLGERMSDPSAVRSLVEDKLVSALRTAAAMKTLEQLNSERDEFLAEVMKLVADDLLSNGLILETVTISRLDQTDERFLKESNIFDAQGWRKIAEITQLNLTERNRLVREGERARKAKDVQTVQELLTLERDEREAAAKQASEIAQVEAETQRLAQEKAIAARREVELAEVEKAQTLEVARREQERAVEVAERVKQERVAEAEQRRAAAERALAEAEAEREKARQQVETVRVTEAAERSKAKAVIDAQAAAETAFVTDQRQADAEAYTRQKQAEARKAAADAEAEAVRKKAEADAEAERLTALGAKARSMVPVEVQRAQVEVDRDRIETVIKPELEAREKHGKVAQDFEIAKLRVAAEQAVQVAFAEASSKLFSKMKATLYGTPEDVTRIMESVVSGQSLAKKVGGFLEAADPTTMAALGTVGSGVKQLAETAFERFVDVDAADDDQDEPEAA
ncbi:MAG: SPFH domain-containing protein [Myxococcota bacterium]